MYTLFGCLFRDERKRLPKDMHTFLRAEMALTWPENEADLAPFRDPALRKLSLRLTGPMTVLKGLEEAGLAESLSASLTVHVVGARAAEAKELAAWEVLPAMLPNIKKFTIVFVGPELR